MTASTFPGGLTQVDYPAFLSQHDVVYLAPPTEGINGLPVGNGDLGAMIWTPTDRLQLQINKVDLWDDRPDGPFTSWGDEDEEVSTTLRSAGTLTLSHGLPTYDQLYLTDFEARLRLAEAQVDVRAATPFARLSATIFVSEAAGVLVVRYQDQTDDALARRIEFSRWGSRSLPHWYRKIRREDGRALKGATSGARGMCVWLTQELRNLHFALAARFVGPVQAQPVHPRAAGFTSEPTTTFAGTLYLAVVTSEETDDPLAEATSRVERAASRGAPELADEHQRSWQRFWESSFVDLPPKQDYLENLWYLNSYHLGSCCKGRYPPNHINALWSWNRDVRPWAHYYHWNEQLHVWPMHATGHGELARPYYHWRRAMLDHAVTDARRVHGREGAFYSDVSNRRGYQATEPGLSHNLTPGAQVAADFWRHYQFTRDRVFLDQEAYPVIREVTRFYLASLAPASDGRSTFVETQPYESNVYTRDTLTDLAHARQLFQIFCDASAVLDRDPELRERCQAALRGLADYVVGEVSPDYRIDPSSLMDLKPVLFKEVTPGDPTMPIWFVGYKVPTAWSKPAERIPDGTPLHEGMGDPRAGRWLFTSTNLAPVVPANQVGLDQIGTPEFTTAVNTVRALGNDSHAFSLGLIAKARLGLADELAAALDAWPQAFQIYPQGFYHYFRENHPDLRNAYTVKEVAVVGTPESIHWPMAISEHMSLEGGPLLQTAIDEMLLQSYSGIIRVFPAVPADWEGQFRLHAVGGFVVGGVRASGQTTYVVIESNGGEVCQVANPWPGAPATLYGSDGGWSRIGEQSGDILRFSTDVGALYLLLPTGRDPGALQSTQIAGNANRGPKALGVARLGIPRGF